MLLEAARYSTLLRAMTQVITAPDAPAGLGNEAGAWLSRKGLAPDDARDIGGLGAHRILVYRRHVRRALTRAVQQILPRTAARLGDAFHAWVDRFVEHSPPRSPYFRDVASEFCAFATTAWEGIPSVPPYLADLARHELALFEAGAADDPSGEAPLLALHVDRPARFVPSARIVRYTHAVHELSGARDACDVPERRPVALFAYRDADFSVHFLELSPLAAGIVGRLLEGAPLGHAVMGASAALGVAVNTAVTSGAAALLQDLALRGALLCEREAA